MRDAEEIHLVNFKLLSQSHNAGAVMSHFSKGDHYCDPRRTCRESVLPVLKTAVRPVRQQVGE